VAGQGIGVSGEETEAFLTKMVFRRRAREALGRAEHAEVGTIRGPGPGLAPVRKARTVRKREGARDLSRTSCDNGSFTGADIQT
jgi:hypothetical protein